MAGKKSIVSQVRAAAEERFTAFQASCKSASWARIVELEQEAARREGRPVFDDIGSKGPCTALLELVLKHEVIPPPVKAIVEMAKADAEAIDAVFKRIAAKKDVRMRSLFFQAEAAKFRLAALRKSKSTTVKHELELLAAETEVERLEAEIACASHQPELTAIGELIGSRLLPFHEQAAADGVTPGEAFGEFAVGIAKQTGLDVLVAQAMMAGDSLRNGDLMSRFARA